MYKGNKVPQIVKPLDDKYWTRTTLIEWLYKEIKSQRNLIGFDFAFSYPFYDRCSYFPGIKDSPINSEKLWKLIEDTNTNAKIFMVERSGQVKRMVNFLIHQNLKVHILPVEEDVRRDLLRKKYFLQVQLLIV